MPTDTRFFWHVTINTHIFFLALQWPLSIINKKKMNPDRPTLDFFDMWQ
jgi:hypothetical protein